MRKYIKPSIDLYTVNMQHLMAGSGTTNQIDGSGNTHAGGNSGQGGDSGDGNGNTSDMSKYHTWNTWDTWDDEEEE